MFNLMHDYKYPNNKNTLVQYKLTSKSSQKNMAIVLVQTHILQRLQPGSITDSCTEASYVSYYFKLS